MNKNFSLFCNFALSAVNACTMAALYTLISTVENMENTDPALGIWLLCVLLCQIGLAVFMKTGRSEQAVVGFIAGFFVLQLVLCFLCYGFFSSLIGVLIAVAMWAYSYYSCYELIKKKLTAERLGKSFDLCCCTLIFLVFFCLVKELSMQMVLPLAFSAFYALMALVLLRGGGTRKVKSLFLSAALVVLGGTVAVVFAALCTGGLSRLVAWLGKALYAVLSFIFACIDAVFLFLMKLLPQKEYEPITPALDGIAYAQEAQDMSFKLMDGETFIIIVLCLAFALALAALIYRLAKGKRKLSFMDGNHEQGIKRKKSNFRYSK